MISVYYYVFCVEQSLMEDCAAAVRHLLVGKDDDGCVVVFTYCCVTDGCFGGCNSVWLIRKSPVTLEWCSWSPAYFEVENCFQFSVRIRLTAFQTLTFDLQFQ